MNRKAIEKQAARRFDGEDARAAGDAPAYTDDLARIREGVAAVRAHASVPDDRFDAFFAGVRRGLDTQRAPAWEHSRWAVVSLAAASLIAAASLWVLFAGEPAPAAATVVEEAHSELDGAKVGWYSSEDGDATVWVELAEEDIW